MSLLFTSPTSGPALLNQIGAAIQNLKPIEVLEKEAGKQTVYRRGSDSLQVAAALPEIGYFQNYTATGAITKMISPLGQTVDMSRDDGELLKMEAGLRILNYVSKWSTNPSDHVKDSIYIGLCAAIEDPTEWPTRASVDKIMDNLGALYQQIVNSHSGTTCAKTRALGQIAVSMILDDSLKNKNVVEKLVALGVQFSSKDHDEMMHQLAQQLPGIIDNNRAGVAEIYPSLCNGLTASQQSTFFSAIEGGINPGWLSMLETGPAQFLDIGTALTRNQGDSNIMPIITLCKVIDVLACRGHINPNGAYAANLIEPMNHLMKLLRQTGENSFSSPLEAAQFLYFTHAKTISQQLGLGHADSKEFVECAARLKAIGFEQNFKALDLTFTPAELLATRIAGFTRYHQYEKGQFGPDEGKEVFRALANLSDRDFKTIAEWALDLEGKNPDISYFPPIMSRIFDNKGKQRAENSMQREVFITSGLGAMAHIRREVNKLNLPKTAAGIPQIVQGKEISDVMDKACQQFLPESFKGLGREDVEALAGRVHQTVLALVATTIDGKGPRIATPLID